MPQWRYNREKSAMANPEGMWADVPLASPIANNAIRLRDLLERARDTIRLAFKEPVWVFAEVQEIKYHQNDHVFLTLVDVEGGQAHTKGNLWQSTGAQRLAQIEQTRGERLRKGEKIFVLCRPEYHPTFGFSITIADIQFAETIGPAEQALRDALKRLRIEGILSRNRDLPGPQVVFRVALVAPRMAEGSLDFQRILSREYDRAPTLVRVHHATFQSEAAAQEIPTAIATACAWHPDIIVLARGGGSKADLLYLNNYSIGRAICDCPVPVWSGIGHSTDKTLIDEVAHRVFKTPSDVAHQIVSLVEAALRDVGDFSHSAARIASVITDRVDLGLRREWKHARSCVTTSLEKAVLKAGDLGTTASSCGKIITEVWVRHLALCRSDSVAAAYASWRRALTNSREQAQTSASNSRLLGERWVHTLSLKQAAVLGTVQNLFRDFSDQVQNYSKRCGEASGYVLRRIENDTTRIRASFEASTDVCLKRRIEQLEDCWQEPKKSVTGALLRASTQARQSGKSIQSLIWVKAGTLQADLSQKLLVTGQASYSAIGHRKLLVDSEVTFAVWR
jgi:exodeoxyribonuclease VII large subunit